MSSALVQDGPPSSSSSNNNNSSHEIIEEKIQVLNSLLESARSQGIAAGKKKKSTAKDGKDDNNTASWRLDTARRLSSVSTNNCLYGLRVVLLVLFMEDTQNGYRILLYCIIANC